MDSDSPDWNTDDFLTSTQQSSESVDDIKSAKRQKTFDPYETEASQSTQAPLINLSNQDMFEDSIHLETSNAMFWKY